MRDEETWEKIPYTREDLVRMYVDEKMSMNAIARKTSMYPSSVRIHLLSMGIMIRADEGSRVNTKHVFDVERAKKMRVQGKSYTDIAHELNVPVSSVKYQVKKVMGKK